MSIDFSTGKYDASTKVFTAANGAQYYISADACGTNALNQSCNTQFCEWGAWTEDADGKASCQQPCSSYVYKQYSLCPNGKCDANGSISRTQYLPCGPNQCASKGLSQFGSCSASCGGGTQSRNCNISPIPVSSNLPQGYTLNVPVTSKSSYTAKAAFSNPTSRSERARLNPPPRSKLAYSLPEYIKNNSYFDPHDSLYNRF